MAQKAYISMHLRDYLSKSRASAAATIKVVIHLTNQPTATINRVPTTARSRGAALEVLRDAGMRGNVLNLAGLQPRHIVEGINAVTVEIPVDKLQALANSPGVEYIRPIRLHRMHLNESVPLLAVDASVRSRFSGQGIRVAVIDSGIDANHPDLRGRVNLGLSRNFTTEGGANDVTDGNGHGTHVSGIIGGAGDTFRGVAPQVEFIACKVFDSTGSAEEGSVLAAVQWAISKGAHVINYSGGFSPIIHTPLGPRVPVAPPWVWPKDLIAEEVEFDRAMNAGIVSVVSAGNDGDFGRRATLSMPATTPAVISVGSVDKNKALVSYSSVGPALRSASVRPADAPQSLTAVLRPSTRSFPEVDLVAPGGGVDEAAARSGGCFFLPGIISALSQTGGISDEEPTCVVDNRYVHLSGTSQAAPHVSGLAALILQAAQSMSVDLGPRKAFAVKGILKAACSRIDRATTAEQGQGLPSWPSIERILQDILAGRIRVSTLSR